jgi:hypothetical protein
MPVADIAITSLTALIGLALMIVTVLMLHQD